MENQQKTPPQPPDLLPLWAQQTIQIPSSHLTSLGGRVSSTAEHPRVASAAAQPLVSPCTSRVRGSQQPNGTTSPYLGPCQNRATLTFPRHVSAGTGCPVGWQGGRGEPLHPVLLFTTLGSDGAGTQQMFGLGAARPRLWSGQSATKLLPARL